MVSRRKAISLLALGTITPHLPAAILSGKSPESDASPASFKFALNTSTINGGEMSLPSAIEIAASAGYDGVEIWIRDLVRHLEEGHTVSSVRQQIEALGVEVVSAIGFAPWLAPGKEGMVQMRQEMEMLAGIGCRRIAAPPAGVDPAVPLDLFAAGRKYRELLDLGRETGVMPQLEFWGASRVLWHLGQVLMMVAVAGDPDVKLLPDVYHMYRGGSAFNILGMLNGSVIDLFHLNDYPGTLSREELNDADRVYPGDGAAPLNQILHHLYRMGGEKILSLELFNRAYWEEEPQKVAETGLHKMKLLAEAVKATSSA